MNLRPYFAPGARMNVEKLFEKWNNNEPMSSEEIGILSLHCQKCHGEYDGTGTCPNDCVADSPE